MNKRTSNQIYGALGEFVLNDEETLFNEEQLKLANQYKFKLKQMVKKSKKERRLLKIQTSILKIPSYIFYFVATVSGFIASPFQWIDDKLNSVGVDYENYIELKSIRKKKPHTEEMNNYAYEIVLPLLEELETDDMSEKHEEYLVRKGLKEKIKK